MPELDPQHRKEMLGPHINFCHFYSIQKGLDLGFFVSLFCFVVCFVFRCSGSCSYKHILKVQTFFLTEPSTYTIPC